MQRLIEAINLEVGFGNLSLIHDVNFSLSQGESLFIMGENGIGKTSLLRTLSGLLQKKSGILLAPEREKIGWSHGLDKGFFPHLTGRENLLWFQSMENRPSFEVETSLMEFANIPILKKCLETEFSLCSTGMKQILLLIQSLLGPKGLIIWDEPLKGLSEENAEAIKNLMKSKSSQKTFLITGHHKKSWDGLCTRFFKIQDGRLHEL